jgi:hypothetical protein
MRKTPNKTQTVCLNGKPLSQPHIVRDLTAKEIVAKRKEPGRSTTTLTQSKSVPKEVDDNL